MRVELLYGVEADCITYRTFEVRGLTVRQSMAVDHAVSELVANDGMDPDEASGLVRVAWGTWVDGLDRHLEVDELLGLRESDFTVLMEATQEVSRLEAAFRARATEFSHSAGAGGEDDRVE